MDHSISAQTLDTYVERARHGLTRWCGISSEAGLSGLVGGLLQYGEVVRGEHSYTCFARITAKLGWHNTRRTLRAQQDGLQAVLAPLTAGGFSIVIDPAPTSNQAAQGLDTYTIIAERGFHEIAHGILYKPGAPPTRAGWPTADEEIYCDMVARAAIEAIADIGASAPS